MDQGSVMDDTVEKYSYTRRAPTGAIKFRFNAPKHLDSKKEFEFSIACYRNLEFIRRGTVTMNVTATLKGLLKYFEKKKPLDDCLPDLDPAEREFLTSGLLKDEFDDYFGEE